jgi:hypothetical protein
MEKRRSRARTPRATHPVLARMLPRSIRKRLAIRKIRHPLTYGRIFPDFSTVAHENDGIKGKREKNVGVLSAAARGTLNRRDAARTTYRVNASIEILRPG